MGQVSQPPYRRRRTREREPGGIYLTNTSSLRPTIKKVLAPKRFFFLDTPLFLGNAFLVITWSIISIIIVEYVGLLRTEYSPFDARTERRASHAARGTGAVVECPVPSPHLLQPVAVLKGDIFFVIVVAVHPLTMKPFDVFLRFLRLLNYEEKLFDVLFTLS